jgi:hypothetical protein
MLKHIIAYSCRLLVLFIAVIGLIAWVFVSKLKNLDSLGALSSDMGLSHDWTGRTEILSKRHPWDADKISSWAAQELGAFLEIKSDLMPALEEWRRRHPPELADPKADAASPASPASDRMMIDVLRMRTALLAALEKRRMSLAAYRYFNELIADINRLGDRATQDRALTAAQREILMLRASGLRSVDTSGVEFLGLPH